MFRGEFCHTLDKKGRIILPVKFRGMLEDGLVIAMGLDECLWIYSRTEWEQREDEIRRLPQTSEDARRYSRMVVGRSEDGVLDKQGRISIPEHLRKYAGLTKEIVIIGVIDRLEIWDKQKWDSYSRETNEDYPRIAERLTDRFLKRKD